MNPAITLYTIFQLPLSGSHDDFVAEYLFTGYDAFNSLSRDHIERQEKRGADSCKFAFNSLSRDHDTLIYAHHITPSKDLSTPSLGITDGRAIEGTEGPPCLSTPSLGITGIW